MESRPDVVMGGAVWETVWEHGAGAAALFDFQEHMVDVNPAMCRMFGYRRKDLLALSIPDLVHPDDLPVDRDVISFVGQKLDSFSIERRMVRGDGRVLWVLIENSLIRSPDGTPVLIAAQLTDVSARHLSETLWRQTMVNAPIGIALLDLDGRCVEVNDKLCDQVGYRRDELVDRHSAELVFKEDRQTMELLYGQLREGRIDACTIQLRLRHREGHPFWMVSHLGLVRGPDDRPSRIISQFDAVGDYSGVADNRLAELTRMALHDTLTGLANRALLLDRFEQHAAELAMREGVLALLVIDIDDFKEINDRYGHETGDDILQIVAGRLLSVVNPGDTVARVGGDEFVVVADRQDAVEVEALRTRMVRRLNLETFTSGELITFGASVGMAVTRDASVGRRTLQDAADRDMYQRKRSRARPGRPPAGDVDRSGAADSQ